MPSPRVCLAAAVCALSATIPATTSLAHVRVSNQQATVTAHGVWLAGDLHVHTIYGHDTCTSPTDSWDDSSPNRSARKGQCADPYTWGFTPRQRLAEAVLRGLNFVALTDHNNVVNQTDPAALAWRRQHPSFIVVPGYENSQAGHVQMLGARGCYGNDGLVPHSVIECNDAVADTSATGMQELADSLRADGGVFQINHPSDMNWLSNYGRTVVPDSIEVWNIGPWAYQHPLPASNDNDFSLRWYDGFLARGDEIAATGGSDSHWRLTDAVQGVGQPTTWVLAPTRTPAGVLAGIRAHRTVVSAEPPRLGGTVAFLEADPSGNGSWSATVGDEVHPGTPMRVRVRNLVPGSKLEIDTDTGAIRLPLTTATRTFTPGVDGVPAAHEFVRVVIAAPDNAHLRSQLCHFDECHNRLVVAALTSPIYVR